ncbi:MAG: hypothetical protein QOI78_7847 [Actinomycetota bacterium]|nr:hypothetical protein [Actinomycetota bacterium]
MPVLVLSPVTGRLVGTRGPRLPLVVAGIALALGGAASAWLGPATPLAVVLAVSPLFGLFLGTVNPPITNTAMAGMPGSMASTGRQTGTTLGVAIAGAVHGVGWVVAGSSSWPWSAREPAPWLAPG